MQCKKCEAELEEGVSLCPNCGFDNSAESAVPAAQEDCGGQVTEKLPEVQEESQQECASAENCDEKSTLTPGIGPGKIVLLVILGILAVAVVVALILGGLKKSPENPENAPTVSTGTTDPVETTEATIPADGNPDDATCKGSYSVSDEEIMADRDTVVATLGDAQLTNGELQVYYWMSFYDFLNMYGNYVGAMGMNPMQSLDTQMSIKEGLTWQQFLLTGAIENWRNYTTLAMKAQEAGYELEEEYQKELQAVPEDLLKKAEGYGYETAEEMVQADMGKGATLDTYSSYLSTYYLGSNYYTSLLKQLELTDEMLEEFFNEHSEEYAANGLTKETKFVDARHILLTPEGGTTDENGNVTYSEEEWEACRVAAQAVLDAYLSGEQTEENFANLAGEHSQDPGSKQNGGLYTDIYEGQMIKPFEEWCFDDARVEGDTGLVKTDYGYHVMYFKQSRPAWIQSARADLMSDKGQKILQDLLDDYELNVDYSAIKLGTVDTGAGN